MAFLIVNGEEIQLMFSVLFNEMPSFRSIELNIQELRNFLVVRNFFHFVFVSANEDYRRHVIDIIVRVHDDAIDPEEQAAETLFLLRLTTRWLE